MWGRPFEIFSDHKPLLGLLGHDQGIPQQCSPRVLRWALTLSCYDYRLKYRPGSNLGNADALSRLPLPVTPAEDQKLGDVFLLEKAYPALMSPAAVARATGRDRVLAVLRERLTTGQHLPVSSGRIHQDEMSAAFKMAACFGGVVLWCRYHFGWACWTCCMRLILE